MYFCSNKDGIKIDDKYVLMHAFVVVVVVIRTKPKLFKNIYFRKKNSYEIITCNNCTKCNQGIAIRFFFQKRIPDHAIA